MTEEGDIYIWEGSAQYPLGPEPSGGGGAADQTPAPRRSLKGSSPMEPAATSEAQERVLRRGKFRSVQRIHPEW